MTRAILITGAAQGIGRFLAEFYAGDGWQVALADVQADRLALAVGELEGAGFAVVGVPMDVTDEASVDEGFRRAVGEFGGLNALVNNAALFTQLVRKPLTSISLAEWNRVIQVNLTGCFLTTRAAVGPLTAAGGGSIVNVSSIGIFTAGNQLAHYNASKAGLIGLTRTAARELGRHNIRVNAVAPGATLTEEVGSVSSQERLETKARERSIPRLQTPKDLAGAIHFLTSDSGAFVTGQLLNVDGGEVFH